jgi:hypothetical protein
MTKKHFIALADALREYNTSALPHGTSTVSPLEVSHTQLLCLADFCQAQNSRFNRARWHDYLAGQCGPKGGKVKANV